jgi:CpXC protein
MSHCSDQSVNLTCPKCQAAFSAPLWVIVDTSERPDLLERIQQGALHHLACPQCSYALRIDAPLLLYRPGQDPVLVYAPAQSTPAAETQEHAGALLDRLHTSLEDGWQDAWLAEGLAIIPYELLADFISL